MAEQVVKFSRMTTCSTNAVEVELRAMPVHYVPGREVPRQGQLKEPRIVTFYRGVARKTPLGPVTVASCEGRTRVVQSSGSPWVDSIIVMQFRQAENRRQSRRLFGLLSVPVHVFSRTPEASPISPRLEVLRELDAVAEEAKFENWDGHGAKAIDAKSQDHAREFLRSLPRDVPDPEPGVDPDGQVSFEWYRGSNRLFVLSVSESGELFFAGKFGMNRIHGAERLAVPLPGVLVGNIRRVFEGSGEPDRVEAGR
jgi:hypothetical protein